MGIYCVERVLSAELPQLAECNNLCIIYFDIVSHNFCDFIKFLDLTHYQTTNFSIFQTERVCRRQFQIRRKWQQVIQSGRKHFGKRRNCSLGAISLFPTVFPKGLFPRGVKRCHCVGMG